LKVQKNQSQNKKTGGKKPTEPNEKPVVNEKTEKKNRRESNSIANGPAQLDLALSGAIARSRIERRIGIAEPESIKECSMVGCGPLSWPFRLTGNIRFWALMV
jgi:hypothetical protein